MHNMSVHRLRQAETLCLRFDHKDARQLMQKKCNSTMGHIIVYIREYSVWADINITTPGLSTLLLVALYVVIVNREITLDIGSAGSSLPFLLPVGHLVFVLRGR
jgi:hypothetical protein